MILFLGCFWSNCKETTTVKMYTFHQNRDSLMPSGEQKDTYTSQLSWIRYTVSCLNVIHVDSTCRGWEITLDHQNLNRKSIPSGKITASVRRQNRFFLFSPPRQSGMFKKRRNDPTLQLIIVHVYFYIFHTYS